MKLKKIDSPGADFDQAKTIARLAAEIVRERKPGYALLVARRQGN